MFDLKKPFSKAVLSCGICSCAEKGRLVKQAWKEGSIFSQASLRTQRLRLADSSFPHSRHFRPVFRLVGPPHRSDILRTQGHIYHSLTPPFLSTTLSKHSGTEVTSSSLNHNLICSTDWDIHCGSWTYTTRFQWLTGVGCRRGSLQPALLHHWASDGFL